MTLGSYANANLLEIAEIAEVSAPERGTIRLRLVDTDGREWLVRVPLDVLDAGLRRLPREYALVLTAETAEDHARSTYPRQAWELSRDPASPELTFSCRADDGCGLQIALNIDPVTAIPSMAVTMAAA
jgi:hypothetical protein